MFNWLRLIFLKRQYLKWRQEMRSMKIEYDIVCLTDDQMDKLLERIYMIDEYIESAEKILEENKKI
jgi:hypothetical protein